MLRLLVFLPAISCWMKGMTYAGRRPVKPSILSILSIIFLDGINRMHRMKSGLLSQAECRSNERGVAISDASGIPGR
jgi:hypothetical protein